MQARTRLVGRTGGGDGGAFCPNPEATNRNHSIMHRRFSLELVDACPRYPPARSPTRMKWVVVWQLRAVCHLLG